MFDTDWCEKLAELDGDAACAAVSQLHTSLLQTEAKLLYLAAHWADLHNGDAVDAAGRALPGMERARRLGAPGTPKVAEFASAEFGALQGIGYIAADNLIADALNLRHRHPLLWQAAISGQVRVWQARKVAVLVAAAGLSEEQAAWVDAATTQYLGTLPWGRFLRLVEARIIEADPEAAEARRRAAELERFVSTGRSNEHGLKTMIAKATAGEVIYFVAMCDRIAQTLAEQGDRDPVGARRSKAIGILANPAQALALLQQHATAGTDTGTSSEETGGVAGASAAAEDEGEPVREGDLHPSQNDADDPAPDRHLCPTCAGAGTVTGDPAAFVRPMAVDPARLLPKAVLYVHVSEETLRHSQVTIKPVLDVAGQAPADGYKVPARMAEALRMRNPAEVFPYSTNLSRSKDADHTIRYLSPDKGGPPGQTAMGNLGPLARRGHRIKTHGRWRLKQPHPGVYLWRSPHGYYFLVDHSGTHRLPERIGAPAWAAAAHGIDYHPAEIATEYEPLPHAA